MTAAHDVKEKRHASAAPVWMGTLQKAGENVRTPHAAAPICARGVCSGRMRGKAVCLSTHPRQHATRTPFPPATCPQPSISRVTFVAYSVGSKLFVGWDSPGSFGASDVFSFHNQMIFTEVAFDSFDYSALELGLKHKLDLGAILARDKSPLSPFPHVRVRLI